MAAKHLNWKWQPTFQFKMTGSFLFIARSYIYHSTVWDDKQNIVDWSLNPTCMVSEHRGVET